MAAGDTNQGLVKKFHRACDIPDLIDPDEVSKELRTVAILRRNLLKEEWQEADDELWEMELGFGDREKLAKELADILVIAYGTAQMFGIDLDWAFREVMDSNMTKVGKNGKVERREDGKILKGPNYRPPNMELVIKGINDEAISPVKERARIAARSRAE